MKEFGYHPETGEVLMGIARSLLSNDGRLEYPDPHPMAAPVDLRPAPSGMRRLVQELIRQEMSELADSMEMETFEEADDFDIEDDPIDPLTPYEKVFDPKDDKAPQSPANGSGATEAEPNVKRSEGDEPATGKHPIADNAGSTERPAGARKPE